MKKYFLFTTRGITERFYCGNIYEALLTDEINYHGCLMTFQDCVNEETCKVFDTRKEANQESNVEEECMLDSDTYAQEAMREEEGYSY